VIRRFFILLIAASVGSVVSFASLVVLSPLCIAAVITFWLHDTRVGWVCLVLALLSGAVGIATAGRPRGHAQRVREASERIREGNRTRA
jgi:hypothetical protein